MDNTHQAHCKRTHVPALLLWSGLALFVVLSFVIHAIIAIVS